jgi:hypothetical protein
MQVDQGVRALQHALSDGKCEALRKGSLLRAREDPREVLAIGWRASGVGCASDRVRYGKRPHSACNPLTVEQGANPSYAEHPLVFVAVDAAEQSDPGTDF